MRALGFIAFGVLAYFTVKWAIKAWRKQDALERINGKKDEAELIHEQAKGIRELKSDKTLKTDKKIVKKFNSNN